MRHSFHVGTGAFPGPSSTAGSRWRLGHARLQPRPARAGDADLTEDPPRQRSRRSPAKEPAGAELEEHSAGPLWQNHDLVLTQPNGRPIEHEPLSAAQQLTASKAGPPDTDVSAESPTMQESTVTRLRSLSVLSTVRRLAAGRGACPLRAPVPLGSTWGA
jgi:hypothetical protein